MSKTVTILGVTGSVGRSATDVVLADPDRFTVNAVTANSNAAKLADSAVRLRARRAVIGDPAGFGALRDHLVGTGIACGAGPAAIEEAAAEPVDVVLSAIVGAAGLPPTAAAIRAGNDIALANKECLVCAGAAFMALAQKHDVRILPVDSEHNALHQLIEGRDRSAIRSYTITASGGPFRTWSAERIASATPAEALNHPVWSMGAKITIDSATLMNKGLELIEAHHLFGIPPDRLDVLVHPQSTIHALVTFSDGSIHAELGAADMRRPIGYCLYWPERAAFAPARLDLATATALTFEHPDTSRFPALGLALEALRQGGGAATILNAANELAVEAFLARRIPFGDIPKIVENALTLAASEGLLAHPSTIDEALALDSHARRLAGADLTQRFAAA